MRIALIVEGKTEQAFMTHLRGFLEQHLQNNMPRLDPVPYDGRIPTGEKLKRVVTRLLEDGKNPADHVIALTDVYTGSQPIEFVGAEDAKRKMRQWVRNEPRFHPHAALHDFEAWLLPYWQEIQRLAGHNQTPPAANPESVDHGKPPSHRLQEIFRIGASGRKYIKARDAKRILNGQDLSISILKCAELKHFVNTILRICGASEIQ